MAKEVRATRRDAGMQQTPEHKKIFREFGGINTQAHRQAIGPGEFAWLENIMPVGHGNLIVLPHRSDALNSVLSGNCYYMKAYNIAGLNYMFMATDTGHAYQVALASPYTRTEITDPMTPQFGTSGLQIDQWENERILIVDPATGYWSWDGALLTGNGVLTDIEVTDGGAYTSYPTITLTGGGGAGATAHALLGVNGTQTVTAGGTGYTAGDIITLVGGTFDQVAKLRVVTVGGGGDITEVAVFDPGSYTALGTPPLAVTGGTGADDATITPNYAVLSAVVDSGGTVPYDEPPQVTFTASGSSGLQGDQAINYGGNFYAPGMVLELVGGTYTQVAKVRVLTTSSGAVQSVAIVDRGVYSVVPANPVSTLGGGSDDMLLDANWSLESATGVAVLVSGPDNGEHVATFSGRAWVSVNRTLNYSAPGSWSDFIGPGSGSTIITDSTLHSEITQLISANNFLYFTGVDSVNVIGDVNVNALGDTVFSNTNLTASIGTELSLTLVPYFRSILLANKSGVYSIYGSTPIKASDALDGIFRAIDFAGTVSAGTVMLENVLCAAFAFSYVGASDARPLIAIFFNKKWFLASQGELELIAGGEEGGLQNLYGTDGTSLYQLFNDPDVSIEWLLQTAYWDMDDVTRTKQVTGFGFEADVPETLGLVDFSIDSLTNTSPYVNTIAYPVELFGSALWINNADAIVSWQNNVPAAVDWAGGGYIMQMQDGDGFGKYVGVTMQSSAMRGSLSSIMLRFLYRESW